MIRMLLVVLILAPQITYAQQTKTDVINAEPNAKISPIASTANSGDKSRSSIACASNPDQEQDESWQPPAWAYLLANSLAAFGAIGALFAIGIQTRASRISSERQLRAYIVPESGIIGNVADVVPDPPELEQFARVVNPKIGPLATIGIKNAGQSPSYNVRHTTSIYIRAYTDPPAILHRLPDDGKPSLMILGPQIGATLDV